VLKKINFKMIIKTWKEEVRRGIKANDNTETVKELLNSTFYNCIKRIRSGMNSWKCIFFFKLIKKDYWCYPP